MPIDLVATTSGVTDGHAAAIARLCRELDIFIFIRPSEAETMHLIDAGFATKSMDVHDKSSNWGPMAGTVPLDPAFSKKCAAFPRPTALEEPEHFAQKLAQKCGPACRPHHSKTCHVFRHGVEQPVQLILSLGVLNKWKELGKLVFADGHVGAIGTTSEQRFKSTMKVTGVSVQPAMVTDTVFVLEPFAMPDEVRTAWGLANEPANRTFFRVSYEFQGGGAQPLFVWAYPVKVDHTRWERGEENLRTVGGITYPWKLFRPVTGDYDLWMVAPHLAWWKLHMHVVKFTDEHGVPSAATFFNNWMLSKLNDACARSNNPVFNHGAEEQNYGFTQALDKKVVMFTSSGDARMVDMADLPRIAAELVYAGYLALWNRRYDEVKPPLCGTTFQKLADAYKEARDELGKLLDEEAPLPAGGTPSAIRQAIKKANELVEKLEEAKEKLAQTQRALKEREVEYTRFSQFSKSLKDAFEALGKARPTTPGTHPGLVKLKTSDFSTRAPKVRGEVSPLCVPGGVLPLMLKLQDHIMNATDTSGGGESQLDDLERWYASEEGLATLTTLSDAVSAAPVRVDTASIDFIPEGAPGRDTFTIALRTPLARSQST
jgi:hypothetical protein